MTAHAEGTFTVASWEEDTFQDLAGQEEKLTKARMGFQLSGDLAGDLDAGGGWKRGHLALGHEHRGEREPGVHGERPAGGSGCGAGDLPQRGATAYPEESY